MKNLIKITCPKCGLSKTKENFYKQKKDSEKLRLFCKKCSNNIHSDWIKKNPEKKYILTKKKYMKEYHRKKYLENPEKVKQAVYDWREKKFGHIKREKQRIREQKELMKIERKKLKDYKKEHITPFTKHIRASIWNAFNINRFQYTNSIEIYIGCSFQELKNHLESKFSKGMTWENKGEWETDHRVTFSSVNTLEEVKKLCHYTNMQPLWKKDHRKKSKYER